MLCLISFFSSWRSSSLHFNFLSISIHFVIKSPSSSEVVLVSSARLFWLATAFYVASSLSFLVSVVIVETVPKVFLFSVTVVISFFSLGFIPTFAAIFSVNDVLFVCESPFIVSGVLIALSPLPFSENSMVFFSVSSELSSVLFHP